MTTRREQNQEALRRLISEAGRPAPIHEDGTGTQPVVAAPIDTTADHRTPRSVDVFTNIMISVFAAVIALTIITALITL